MAVILLERVSGIRFSDLDHRSMDIKPDVHTVRVLYRLGVAAEMSEAEAIAAARRLRPEYPGEVDVPLWMIGRQWCRARAPLCDDCVVKNFCARRDLE
jgi:endonuclease III